MNTKPGWPAWSADMTAYRPLRSTFGPHHLLGGRQYTPACATSVAETFRKWREQQEAEREARERREAEEREP